MPVPHEGAEGQLGNCWCVWEERPEREALGIQSARDLEQAGLAGPCWVQEASQDLAFPWAPVASDDWAYLYRKVVCLGKMMTRIAKS